MKTVFMSGSRHLVRINELIRERVKSVISKNLQVLIGDANGADKALQAFLAECRYPNVVVFCSGAHFRNNIGEWEVEHVFVDPETRGRTFYMEKDKKMASEADSGLVLWDGKSAGSISNVFELLKREKPITVYFSPRKKFFAISSQNDLQALLDECDPKSLEVISKKISLPWEISNLGSPSQGT